MHRGAQKQLTPEMERDYLAQVLQEKLELAASLGRLIDQSSGAPRRNWENELEEVTRQIAHLTKILL